MSVLEFIGLIFVVGVVGYVLVVVGTAVYDRLYHRQGADGG